MKLRKLLGCFDLRMLFELVPALAIFAAFVFGRRLAEPGTMAYTVFSLLGAAAAAFMVLVIVGSIRRLDELQQRIHLIGITVSFTVVGMIALSAELLEKGGVSVPPIGVWLWLVMVGVWFTGVIVMGRRYQ